MSKFINLRAGDNLYANIENISYQFKLIKVPDINEKRFPNINLDSFVEYEYEGAELGYSNSNIPKKHFKLALQARDLEEFHTHGMMCVGNMMYPCEVYSDCMEFNNYVAEKINGYELPTGVISVDNFLYTYDSDKQELNKVKVVSIKEYLINAMTGTPRENGVLRDTEYFNSQCLEYDTIVKSPNMRISNGSLDYKQLVINVKSHKYGTETFKAKVNDLTMKDSYLSPDFSRNKKLYIDNNFILKLTLSNIRSKIEELESQEEFIKNELFS